MQKSIWHDVDLKPFCNYFCNCEESLFFEFVNTDFQTFVYQNFLSYFDEHEIYELYKYVVVKNALSGVSELAIFAQRPDIAFKVMQEANLQGLVLCEFDKFLNCQTQKISSAIYIESLLDLSESQIEEISDFCAKQKIPLFIKFLQDLDEAGEISKAFGSDALKILEDFGLLDRELYLVGCNYLDKCDADNLLSYDKTCIVLTPVADMQLARGAVNINPLLQNGVKLKLGSGENFDINMLVEARAAIGQTANIMHDKVVGFDEAKAMISSQNANMPKVGQEEFDKQKEKVEKIFEKYIAKNIFGGKN